MASNGTDQTVSYGDIARHLLDVAMRIAPWAALGMWVPYLLYLDANAELLAAYQHFGNRAFEAMSAAAWMAGALSIVILGYALLPNGWRSLAAVVALAVALPGVAAMPGTAMPEEVSDGVANSSGTAAEEAGTTARGAQGQLATAPASGGGDGAIDFNWDVSLEDLRAGALAEPSDSARRVSGTLPPTERGEIADPSDWKAFHGDIMEWSVNALTTERPGRYLEVRSPGGNERVQFPVVAQDLYLMTPGGPAPDAVHCYELVDQELGTALARINEDTEPVIRKLKARLREALRKLQGASASGE